MTNRAFYALALALFLAAAYAAPTLGQQGAAPGAPGQGRAGGPGGQGGPGGRGGRGAVTLAEGPGRDAVQTTCSRCHGLNLIANSAGYTKAGWQDRIATMVALPAAELETISTYLAAHYPLKDAPGAVLLSGPAHVTIKEWMIPTLGSRPHDSYGARDGSVWWTGMFVSKMGRLDPRTGEMREFDLPQGTQPHGLAEDKDGNIWYTGIQKGVIGKLDPRTGQAREYPLNEPGARGPHTPIYSEATGNLFFTLQSGHVGRINTTGGEMVIMKTPSDNTYPYGIRLNSQGVPWYVDFRGNRIGSVDPRTMEIREFTLPNADSRPRRLTIMADDTIFYTDFPRGMLGHFDPKTGQVKEWMSPSGPESEPYGITRIGNIVWYSESGVRPNTIVRFDPATEKFQTWAIPSGGGVLRHFEAAQDGRSIVTANSGVNKIGVIEIGTLSANRSN
ncbi:MAG: cytochrome C [Vicinamibacterales bacterium]